MTLYYISAVRMDASNQHIEYVKIIKGGKGEADTTINSRQFVAELINDGATKFKTITKKDGQWVNGADVHVIDDIYLSTDRNNTKRDNLGNLPKF
ncbi:DUF3892 domain-containing protein [Serratia sp. JSRIV001]|uniref:DUF3892 domain-containing protein n=1 Tax=Serratia sp. JSRIV001 TaxID=2831893 RepID=UPI001CBDE10B|nr:DUF3892 domain-containing protein [Serratia sp. JSRIV001]UAN44780.1 DUF3892 domain-containing protein [Serratia sp. JSRIV001]